MKTHYLSALALLLFVAAPLIVEPQGAYAQAPAPQKWEYHILNEANLAVTLDQALTNLGDAGWELVAVTETLKPEGGTLRRFYFKRPKN